jgi:hypothetical protein
VISWRVVFVVSHALIAFAAMLAHINELHEELMLGSVWIQFFLEKLQSINYLGWNLTFSGDV